MPQVGSGRWEAIALLALAGVAVAILSGLFGSALDEWPEGLTAQERRGRQVFIDQGCARCHSGGLGAPADAFDLRTTGAPRSAGWHAMHLFEPPLARGFSTMPASPDLFEPTEWDPAFDEGLEPPTLRPDGEALVAYLLRLQSLPARAGARHSGLTPLTTMMGGDDDSYRIWCSSCHGTEGNGDGPGAAFLSRESRPRAFRPARFRVRSRAGLPTDDDLLSTITNGLPGTAMPDFAHLSERERLALVGFIQGYARSTEGGVDVDPFGAGVREPMAVGEPPAVTPELLRRGDALLASMQCAQCHGELAATADDTPPPDLTWTDEIGRPLPRAPHLLTGRLKGGERPRDVYLRVMTGMSGSPMPAYAEALPSEVDRWALVLALLGRRGPAASAP